MSNVVVLGFPTCCECGKRATKQVDLNDESGVRAAQKHFCPDHGNALTEMDLCLLIDEKNKEIADLRRENAILRGANTASPPQSDATHTHSE